jgi:hypothetical protein
MKKVLIAVAIVLVGSISCQPKKSSKAATDSAVPGKASDALLRFYAALNSHDTSRFEGIFPHLGKNENVRTDMIQRLVYRWYTRHADITILSDSTVHDTSFVTYHIKITGDNPVDTLRTANMIFRNGGWQNVTEPPPFHRSTP